MAFYRNEPVRKPATHFFSADSPYNDFVITTLKPLIGLFSSNNSPILILISDYETSNSGVGIDDAQSSTACSMSHDFRIQTLYLV